MEANSILAYENNGVKYTFNNINSIIKGGILPATLYDSIDSSLIVDGFPPQDYSKDDSNPQACPIYDKQTRKFYLRVLGGDKDNRLYYTKWRAGGYYDMHVDYPSSDYYYQYTSHICIDLDDYTPYFVGEALTPDEIVTKLTIPRYTYNKVDKETGKGLSTNDYTTAEKTKLAGIAANAEVNVQSDWNATSGDAFIKNKPTIPSDVSDLNNDSGFVNTSGVNSIINSRMEVISRSAYNALTPTQQASKIYFIYEDTNSSAS